MEGDKARLPGFRHLRIVAHLTTKVKPFSPIIIGRVNTSILDRLASGPATIHDLAAACQEPAPRVRAALRKLRDSGAVQMRGNTKGATYALADSAPSSSVEIKQG